MLRPAHIGHLALLRSLIRDAARDGAFDPELAWDSPAAERFFTDLRQALKTGYFVVTNARTGVLQTISVPGYVYWPDDAEGSEPAGFGIFRALNNGYELWLAGLEASLRGKGHGKAMLEALFATPAGRETKYMRVRHAARHARAIEHLLAEHGFTPTRETHNETWFVRVTGQRPRPRPTASRAGGAIVATDGMRSGKLH
jgi:ribosomal protein S18 acetylase RimI-like enzyme